MGAGAGLGAVATGARGARGGGSAGSLEEGSVWRGKSYTTGSNATSGGEAISEAGGIAFALAVTGGGLKARGAL